MQRLFGIIGYPLTHSFSPTWFNKKFHAERINAVYRAFPIADINQLPDLIKDYPALAGLNVTIPYKQSVIPLLNEIDNAAKDIGAVNCIAIANGYTKGYNTDIIGFKKSLEPLLRKRHTEALVLGTGGAAQAVKYVLKELGVQYRTVSRKKGRAELTYKEVTPVIIDKHKLIINTTPAGMHPKYDDAPAIPYTAITKDHLLYDLIYNPEQTEFLSRGKKNGAQIKNGLEMLHLQAIAGWNIWNQK